MRKANNNMKSCRLLYVRGVDTKGKRTLADYSLRGSCVFSFCFMIFFLSLFQLSTHIHKLGCLHLNYHHFFHCKGIHTIYTPLHSTQLHNAIINFVAFVMFRNERLYDIITPKVVSMRWANKIDKKTQ